MPLYIDILTLFPEAFIGPLNFSIIKRAQQSGYLEINIFNPREFTTDRYRKVDDYPYGGGRGMILKPEPIFRAVEYIKKLRSNSKIILFSPQGVPLIQALIESLSRENSLIFICGHYEGIDERISLHLADIEISIGDYILTGGEIPALVLIDAISRMFPEVIDREVVEAESFTKGIFDYPQYTRPSEFMGYKVPDVLLSGNHKEIELFRRKEALRKTLNRRPDLLAKAELSSVDRKLLQEIFREIRDKR
ncbi:MAG: tRNA (guanosine(37)-N1)-methyltransferase TrmD [bacterium]